jgi:hypothetical protein
MGVPETAGEDQFLMTVADWHANQAVVQIYR